MLAHGMRRRDQMVCDRLNCSMRDPSHSHDRCARGRRAAAAGRRGLAGAEGPHHAGEARLGHEAARSSAQGADARAARAHRHVRRAADRAGDARFACRRPVHAQRRLEHDVRPRHHRRDHDRDRARADLAAAPDPWRSRVDPAIETGGKPTSVDIRYDTPAGPVQARAHLAHHGDAVRVESVAFRNVAVVRVRAVADGAGRRPQDSGRRRLRRRVLRHRRCRGGRRADRRRAPARAAQARHDDRARSREAAPRGASERRRARRHLRHDLHRAGAACPTRTCATSRSSRTPKSIARRAAPAPRR